MIRPILNGKFELPEDGWHQIAPLGEHAITVEDESGRRVRLVQVLDAQSAQAMVNRFQADGDAVLVDYDHFSMDTEKPSRAAGWLLELANRDDGLWGKIRWSASGQAAVAGGEYRYLSPVFDGADVDDLGGDRIRPRRLARAAVTNDPNIRGMAPLSNRNSGGQAAQPGKEQDMKDKLAPVLGLAADAADDAVVAKVTDLVNRAQQAETLQARVTELETAELARKIEADLAEFKDVIQDAEAVKTQLLANRDGARKLLLGLRKVPASGAQLPNRRSGTPPDGDPGAGSRDGKRAAAIRNRASEIARTQRGVPYSTAWNLAQRELGG